MRPNFWTEMKDSLSFFDIIVYTMLLVNCFKCGFTLSLN